MDKNSGGSGGSDRTGGRGGGTGGQVPGGETTCRGCGNPMHSQAHRDACTPRDRAR